VQKIVYKLNKGNDYWTVAQFVPYPKSEMCLLFMALHPVYDWITVQMGNNQVVIWDSFDEKYDSLENASKLYLSFKNYDEIIQYWNKNTKNPSPYLVFARDSTGWITIESKDELLQEDLDAIEFDKKAREVYEQERTRRLLADKK